MPVDASVFNNIKNYQDYNMANQDFLARQQAAQLDAATKGSVLKGQLIGAAAATNDPAALISAKQKAQSLGIDVSDVPNDPQGAVTYANALINAQKPYALGNAQIKALGLNAAGITALGNQPDAAAAGLQMQVPTGAIQIPQPQSTQPTMATSITPKQAMTQPPSAFMGALKTANSVPANAPAATLPQQASSIDSVLASAQNPTPLQPSIPNSVAIPPQPIKDSLESPANFNARLSAWQALPVVKAADAALTTNATDTAKEGVKLKTGAEASQEIFDKLNQNLDALSALNPKVPTAGLILSPDAQAHISTGLATNGLGSGEAGDALKQWDQINHQQILNGLQQLVQSGAIRSNKTIAEMLKTGAGIDANGGTVAGRQAQIDNLRTELKNATVAAQNQSTAINGGVPQPYNSLPQSNVNADQPAPAINPTDAINELRRRGKI